ncbi:trypsin-like serine protease [Pseudomonas syringae]
MKRVTSISSASFVLLFTWSAAFPVVGASVPASNAAPEELIFKAFAERIATGDIQLVNGVRATPQNWPTILNAQLSAPNQDPPETCTGVLVGPGVFLTAAHCLDGGLDLPIRSSIYLQVGGQKLPVTCLMADEYTKAIADGDWNFKEPRVSQDYALCKFNVPNVLPAAFTDLRYENIDSANTLASGDPVLMSGFGCSDRAILVNPNSKLKLDGILRIGNATIHAAGVENQEISNQFASIQSPLDSAPALCRGDSGGPLFSGATTAQQTLPRKIRAVNSSVLVMPAKSSGYVAVSRVAPLATDAFRQFVKTWLSANKQTLICGINVKPGHSPCRS